MCASTQETNADLEKCRLVRKLLRCLYPRALREAAATRKDQATVISYLRG